MIVNCQMDGWFLNFVKGIFHPSPITQPAVRQVIRNPIVTQIVGVAFPAAIPFLNAYNAASAVSKYVETKKQNATAMLQAQGARDANARAAAEMVVFERDFVSNPTDSRAELVRKRKNVLAKLGKTDTQFGALWTPVFSTSFFRAPAPAPVVRAPVVAPAPFFRAPAPAPVPVVRAPVVAPAPFFRAPAPAPVVRAPVAAPAPFFRAPAPAPIVRAPVVAPPPLTPQQRSIMIAQGLLPKVAPLPLTPQQRSIMIAQGLLPKVAPPPLTPQQRSIMIAQGRAPFISAPIAQKPAAPAAPVQVVLKPVDETPLYETLLKANTLYLQQIDAKIKAAQKAAEPVLPVVAPTPTATPAPTPQPAKTGAALLIPAALVALTLLG